MYSFSSLLKYITPLFFLYFPVFASDLESTLPKETKKCLNVIDRDATKLSSPETMREIASASIRILEFLQASQATLSISETLAKGAGKAFGQLSFISPYTLQFFESSFVPLLAKRIIKYEDLRTPYYEFKFGEKIARHVMSLGVLQKMQNGQTLALHHHLNFPVLINKLLNEFEGTFLLVGGGQNCECEQAAIRHPKSLFYHVDIDNKPVPDMVIHAGYLEHLYTFPNERFDFIWFEHCTIAEMLGDEKIIDQYFRFSKTGALFLLQSNYLSSSQKDAREITKKAFSNFEKALREKKFTMLEHKEYAVKHKGLKKNFTQLIFIKPFRKDFSLNVDQAEGPTVKPKLKDYRELTEKEVSYIYPHVEAFTHQKRDLTPRLYDIKTALQMLSLMTGQVLLKWNIPQEMVQPSLD